MNQKSRTKGLDLDLDYLDLDSGGFQKRIMDGRTKAATIRSSIDHTNRDFMYYYYFTGRFSFLVCSKLQLLLFF